jgi:thiosulfate/3-mercaptopyruvate sulfurtransferase
VPPSTDPLIKVGTLAALLAAGKAPTTLDVRWELQRGPDRGAYLEAHIPGAAFVDLDTQLAEAPSGRGRHPLPDAQRFGVEMRRLGVSGSRPVVVYDAAGGIAAARAWWLLRYFGHPSVALLDGGLAAWREAGDPLESGAVAPGEGDFVARAGGMPVVDADGAARVAAKGILIDARARERFLGHTEPIDPVAGHIPGAANRPSAENVESSGVFRDASELRAAFQALGVRETIPLACYCGSGVAAAHEVLALELAGYRAALYPGSWSEWIADGKRPVEREA